MMRTVPVLVLSCLLLMSSQAVAAESYAALVERVKKGDTKIDYRALRDAYAVSPGYQPYGGSFDDARTAMREAFAAKKCADVTANGEKVLNEIYVHILAHLLMARCYDDTNNKPKGEFHRTVARGLLDSIAASGDGKTPETAFIVVTIDEEYDLLARRGLNMKGQSLVHTGGHSFDRMDVEAEDGSKHSLFFQIDGPMRWLASSLKTP